MRVQGTGLPCCIGAVLMAMPHIEEKFSISYFPGESKYFTNTTMLNIAKIFLLHSKTFRPLKRI